MMSPSARRLALTTHVSVSVGWIGAVLVFLALALAALKSEDALVVRGAYLLMELAAWHVLVPLAFAALITGVVMSLGTNWGLLRHWWVACKLGLTVLATIVLLVYMQTFRAMARAAADPSLDLDALRNPSPVLHAVLALIVLVTATVLAIYKPVGLTPFGRRRVVPR